MKPSRRAVMQGIALSALGGRAIVAAAGAPPVRVLTKGPSFHWFGYYDKHQFDSTDRYVLSMKAGFEHRQPTPEDVIELGMIDTASGDRWIPLGDSRAWCWQQGCMLQWLPGSSREVIWNDRQGVEHVAHVLDVKTRKRRTLPGPVYAVSPDGRWAVAPDFRRLADLRPGYGYAGVPDPNKEVGAPTDSGVWRLDLRTGKRALIVSIADALKVGPQVPSWEGAHHWFNHLLVAPDGKRFVWLHRWKSSADKKWRTRMLTARPDGSRVHLVNAGDEVMMVSHFIWRDPKHILAWAHMPKAGNRFYLFRDQSAHHEVVGDGVMMEDGHCTYVPGRENAWILNDTYPQGPERLQRPYLYHVPTGKKHELGAFPSPPAYTGPWRVDTHPRVSRDGTKVTIDSAHAGGRQLYLIDIAGIVGKGTRAGRS